MIKFRLSQKQRERLDLLATKLESLSPRYKHFEMKDFVDTEMVDREAIMNYALHNGGVDKCGTVACAVGHGPAAGILVPRSMLDSTNGLYPIDWVKYSGLFVGLNWTHRRPQRDLWHFLFAGAWAEVDNHHYGAAARIRYILAGNPLPEDCNYYGDGVDRRWKTLYRKFDKRYNKEPARV